MRALRIIFKRTRSASGSHALLAITSAMKTASGRLQPVCPLMRACRKKHTCTAVVLLAVRPLIILSEFQFSTGGSGQPAWAAGVRAERACRRCGHGNTIERAPVQPLL